MAKAGAQLVGVNCLFDPNILLDVMSDMKQSLELFNLDPYLMIQPLGNDPLLRLYLYKYFFCCEIMKKWTEQFANILIWYDFFFKLREYIIV